MTKGIDYTSRDYEAYKQDMIESLQRRMPEYTDISETDAGIVILECLADGLDILSLYNDIVANDVILSTTQDRRLAVILARQMGYVAKNQTASVFKQVFVLTTPSSEDTIIPRGTVVYTPETNNSESIYFETIEDLIIPAGKLGDEKDEEGNYIYTTIVEQGETITEDLLGSSDGTAYQSFILNYNEVITDSIRLSVDQGDGFEEWKQVDSFLEYGAQDLVYTVNVDEFDRCFIEFGNGTNGRIPTPCLNGIVCTYRVGGGKVGNVNAYTITKMEENIAFVEKTFNPDTAMTLARDKESIDIIKDKAARAFRTRDRAVTLQDYGDLVVINYPTIAHAVGVRDTTDKMLVHVYYQMAESYESSLALINSLNDFFDERVMIGTTYDFNEAVPFEVDISVNVLVWDDYSSEIDTMITDIEDYIRNVYFSYGAFDFGESLYINDIERHIFDNFSGIRSIRVVIPVTDIVLCPEGQYITLGRVAVDITTKQQDFTQVVLLADTEDNSYLAEYFNKKV